MFIHWFDHNIGHILLLEQSVRMCHSSEENAAEMCSYNVIMPGNASSVCGNFSDGL